MHQERVVNHNAGRLQWQEITAPGFAQHTTDPSKQTLGMTKMPSLRVSSVSSLRNTSMPCVTDNDTNRSHGVGQSEGVAAASSLPQVQASTSPQPAHTRRSSHRLTSGHPPAAARATSQDKAPVRPPPRTHRCQRSCTACPGGARPPAVWRSCWCRCWGRRIVPWRVHPGCASHQHAPRAAPFFRPQPTWVQ